MTGMHPNIPLMIWYGIEPAVPGDKPRAVRLAATSKIPLVRQFIDTFQGEIESVQKPDG